MAPLPPVCSTTTVFHHFLHGLPDAERLAADGLTAKPAGAEELAVHREVYAELFEPALRRPFTAPGVFFTPIDFHVLAETALATAPRSQVAIERLDPRNCVLTWELDGERVRLSATAQALRAAAAVWSPERIVRWFGVRRDRLFWHLPQIGCFTGAPIPVSAPQWPTPLPPPTQAA